jgi:putative glutamine amidotransferase
MRRDMRPLIGVTPLWDEERQSVWMLPDYLEGIQQAGGVPVVLPFDSSPAAIEEMVERFDGFLFTGGPDVSPALYGLDDMGGKIKTCPRRDELEVPLLKKAVAAGKPIFGICRGLQLINAVLGGTLYRDLPSEHPSEIVHRQAKPYGRDTHTVFLQGPLRELLADLTGLTDLTGLPASGAAATAAAEAAAAPAVLPVNTLHHQAVRELAPGLEPMAVTPDGLIEAFYAPEARFLWAVQWHPEYLFRNDAASRRLFKRFVDACVV